MGCTNGKLTTLGQKRPNAVSPVRKKDMAFDVLAFLVTVVCVAVFHWQARDVIWGLWSSSLCVGYAFIVTAIVWTAYHAKGRERLRYAGGGVVLLVFFTIHFGMFHFGHAVFLNAFFPLLAEQDDFLNFAILRAALRSYWPLVLTSFVSRFQSLRSSGFDLKSKSTFMKPYANVIRMHVLIFVFAGLAAAKLSQLAIYPVLALYFFPWGNFLRRLDRRSETEERSDQRG